MEHNTNNYSIKFTFEKRKKFRHIRRTAAKAKITVKRNFRRAIAATFALICAGTFTVQTQLCAHATPFVDGWQTQTSGLENVRSQLINKKPNAGQVIVGVIDLGIDSSAENVSNRIIDSYHSSTNVGQKEYDAFHGTAVISIIADATRDINGIGILPYSAPMVRDMCMNIKDCVDKGAKVINISLKFRDTGASMISIIEAEGLVSACKYALSHDCSVVFAAGNDNESIDKDYLAKNCPGVIFVSALTNSTQKSDYSNFGEAIDIAAFGDAVHADYANYSYFSGTSAAAPQVVAALALIRTDHPEYTREEAEQLLFTQVEDIGEKGKDTLFGYGRLDMNNYVVGATSLENPEGNTEGIGIVTGTVPEESPEIEEAKDEMGWGRVKGEAPSPIPSEESPAPSPVEPPVEPSPIPIESPTPETPVPVEENTTIKRAIENLASTKHSFPSDLDLWEFELSNLTNGDILDAIYGENGYEKAIENGLFKADDSDWAKDSSFIFSKDNLWEKIQDGDFAAHEKIKIASTAYRTEHNLRAELKQGKNGQVTTLAINNEGRAL